MHQIQPDCLYIILLMYFKLTYSVAYVGIIFFKCQKHYYVAP